MCVSLCVWCARECKKKHQQRNINKQKKERRERDRRERAREKEREKDERRSNEKKKKKKKTSSRFSLPLSRLLAHYSSLERDNPNLLPSPFFVLKREGLFFFSFCYTRAREAPLL